MRKRKRRIDSSEVLVLIIGVCLLGAVSVWVRDSLNGTVSDYPAQQVIVQKQKTEMQTTEKDGEPFYEEGGDVI